MDNQASRELKMHETTTIAEMENGSFIEATRVPGGMLYNTYHIPWKTFTSVFVPLPALGDIKKTDHVDYGKFQDFMDGKR